MTLLLNCRKLSKQTKETTMTPYLTVPFSLSDEAWNLAHEMIKPVVDDWTKNSTVDGGLVNITQSNNQSMFEHWKDTIIWKEITAFTDTLGLTGGAPQFFIYRKNVNKTEILGNPHIDAASQPGPEFKMGPAVPIRFNILLAGEDNCKMNWWNKDTNSKNLIQKPFTRPDKSIIHILEVAGDTVKERCANLGKPQWTSNTLSKLNEKASFVRTNILHSVDWNGQHLRVVLSVRFEYPQKWDLTENYQNKIKEQQ